jgi:hypothetical protein
MASREEVYNAIDTERDYQDLLIAIADQEDMHELTLGEQLAVLHELLSQANSSWYTDATPYKDTMPLIRKIAGVCVNAMETYGAPRREVPSGLVDRKVS